MLIYCVRSQMFWCCSEICPINCWCPTEFQVGCRMESEFHNFGYRLTPLARTYRENLYIESGKKTTPLLTSVKVVQANKNKKYVAYRHTAKHKSYRNNFISNQPIFFLCVRETWQCHQEHYQVPFLRSLGVSKPVGKK